MSIMKPPFHTELNLGHRLSQGIVGCWLFNEAPPPLGSALDLSGNGNHGTLVGDTHSVPGKFGPALDFDGAVDEVYITNDASNMFTPSGGTFLIWFKAGVQLVGDTGYMFAHRESGVTNRIYIQISADTTNNDLYFGFGNNKQAITSDNNVENDGKWHFAVITWTIAGCIGYLDGIEIGTYSYTLPSTAGNIAIGDLGHADSYNYRGQVDHALIYNRALNAGEINELYRDPFQMFKRNL